MEFTLGKLAEFCDASVVGDAQTRIDGVSNLRHAGTRELSLYSDRKYKSALACSNAAAILTTPSLADDVEGAKLVVDNPMLALARVLTLFSSPQGSQRSGIDRSADISASASLSSGVSIASNVSIGERVELGEGVRVGSGSVIQDDVRLGDQTRIDANVTIYAGCQLGRRCHISSGTVIGADGFGFAENRENAEYEWVAIPQTGRVLIGDDVHIGANTAIDRGSLEDTELGDGVIIDNLVQIAHNVKIGRHTAIAGCAAIAGSTQIGENCKLGGRASIIGHLNICDNVTIFADSLVTKSIHKAGVYSSAMPAMPISAWRKLLAKFRSSRITK